MSDQEQVVDTTKTDTLAKALNDQAAQISEETVQVDVGEQSANANPKDVSVSKMIINWAFVIIGVVGIAGAFLSKLNLFDMDAYVKFIQNFAYIYVPLIVAVGSGRAFKNFVNKKYQTPNNSTSEK